MALPDESLTVIIGCGEAVTTGYGTPSSSTNSTYTNVTLDSFGYFYNFGATPVLVNSLFDHFNVYYS